ncbi:MAG: carbamoyltransferase HypF, partial [Enterobacterales bacterium]|nr:carbamoyltransferase HypF [Enterobacterales bacterium]
VERLPYDRPNTTMREFPLCQMCHEEYENPNNRRFHAQPNACEACGPNVWLESKNNTLSEGHDAIAETAELIRNGKIVAIRGVGGYQLLCDARNNAVVTSLRQRKSRPAKAFALMVRDIAQLKTYADVSSTEEKVLSSPQAPIVLIKCSSSKFTKAIAPNLNRLGFVLPYSPLHILLMNELDFPVVFTSGNLSNNPQCTAVKEARGDLSEITDYYLHHNRDITNRVDDSVLTVFEDKPMAFRLGRGYAPISNRIDKVMTNTKAILACGSQVKNTFSLIDGERLITSQHIGDLTNQRINDDFETQLALQKQLFAIKPDYVAVDLHPDYQASIFGREYAKQHNIECYDVQHHHAHLAACLYDNGYPADADNVLGVVMDGTGYGPDETIWGGEFLYGSYAQFKRLGRISPVAMPGSAQAILQPWRMLYSYLQHHQFKLSELPAQLQQVLKEKPLETIDKMLENNINSPLTSSCGRLFDAVAAALGICSDSISYEGQAAIELQQAAENYTSSCKPSGYHLNIKETDGYLEIDTSVFWTEVIADININLTIEDISAKFHIGFAQVVTNLVVRLAEDRCIEHVALCGGVFQNQYLLSVCMTLLTNAGFKCLYHNNLPANDACISIGQACVVASQSLGA